MSNLSKIAKLVGKGLKKAGMTLPATLTVVTVGTRTPGAVSGGANSTTTDVTCRGLVRTWKRTFLGATVVQVGDRVVMLFGSTLGSSVPKVGDRITIESVTGRVIDIERDPASAVYACLTRA